MKKLKVHDQERYEKGVEWVEKQLLNEGFDLNRPIEVRRETIVNLRVYTQKD